MEGHLLRVLTRIYKYLLNTLHYYKLSNSILTLLEILINTILSRLNRLLTVLERVFSQAKVIKDSQQLENHHQHRICGIHYIYLYFTKYDTSKIHRDFSAYKEMPSCY